MKDADLRVVAQADAAAFLARAERWLMEREDEHNLVLSLAALLAPSPPAEGADGYLFVTVERSGEVVGAAFRTPPYKAGLTRMPVAAAPAVAAALGARYRELPSVFGPPEVADAVGHAWAELRGVMATPGPPQRLYRLDEVVLPVGVPGAMRVAGPGDLERVHAWGEGFTRDAGAGFGTSAETRARWVSAGALHLWEDAGEPVSMALATGRTPNGVRIGYVYTPPEVRGRGYASMLTAALSQKALGGGARFCVLYTDLTNPVSNAIYPRVGYRPLVDLGEVEFGAGAA